MTELLLIRHGETDWACWTWSGARPRRLRVSGERFEILSWAEDLHLQGLLKLQENIRQ